MGGEEWEKQLMAGNEAAVEEVIRLYYAEILRYCRWHLADQTCAEDVAQETFLKFFRYLGSYSHQGKLKAYLYRIAANTCTDWQRKRKSEALPEEWSCEERGYDSAEQNADFIQQLRVLSQSSREIVLLRFGQDLTLREIGEVLNLPLRTVQSRLKKALKQLKQELMKGEGDHGGI